MNQQVKISVIIPTFNRVAILERTLISLHAQTFRDFEIIIVDDGSTDDTAKVVARFRALFIGKSQSLHVQRLASGRLTEFAEKLTGKSASLRAQRFTGERGGGGSRRTRDEIASVASGDLAMTEGTRTEIASPSKGGLAMTVEILYLHQKNQGQGSARNLGVEHVRAPITLFIGDDIIAEPILLAEHVRYHEEHPEENAAVLGFIDWHPDLVLTPFMKWMTNGSCILGCYGGHQFAYEKLNGPKMTDAAFSTRAVFQPGQFPKKIANYNFFYTSNISLKTSLLRRYPFDPAFQKYGWEDIELGYRLTQKENLVMYYAPQAKAFHYHPMNESSLAPRMRQIGASAHIIDRKYPELRKVPSRFKKIVFFLISSWPILCFFDMMRKILRSQSSHDYYYYALSKKYFLEGLKRKYRGKNK